MKPFTLMRLRQNALSRLLISAVLIALFALTTAALNVNTLGFATPVQASEQGRRWTAIGLGVLSLGAFAADKDLLGGVLAGGSLYAAKRYHDATEHRRVMSAYHYGFDQGFYYGYPGSAYNNYYYRDDNDNNLAYEAYNDAYARAIQARRSYYGRYGYYPSRYQTSYSYSRSFDYYAPPASSNYTFYRSCPEHQEYEYRCHGCGAIYSGHNIAVHTKHYCKNLHHKQYQPCEVLQRRTVTDSRTHTETKTYVYH